VSARRSASYGGGGGGGGGPVTLVGDVNGASNANQVDSIQAIPVNMTGIANGDFLAFNGSAVVPTAAPTAGIVGADKTVRVDPFYGSPTGSLGDYDKPYDTVSGALGSASASADVYTVLLPSDVDESVTVPSMASQAVVFSSFVGDTAWTHSGGGFVIEDTVGTAIGVREMTLVGVGVPAVDINGGSKLAGFIRASVETDAPGISAGFNDRNVYEDTTTFNETVAYTDCPSIQIIRGNGAARDVASSVGTSMVAVDSFLPSIFWTGDGSCSLERVSVETVDFAGSSPGFVLRMTDCVVTQTATINGDIAFPASFFVGTEFRDDVQFVAAAAPTIVRMAGCRFGAGIILATNITLDLSGSDYDPGLVDTSGGGAYIDTRNPRVAVVEGAATGTAVRPRDSIVSADNSSGAVNILLGPASTSTGVLTVEATNNPLINDVTITANGSDTIEGFPSYSLAQELEQSATFVALNGASSWTKTASVKARILKTISSASTANYFNLSSSALFPGAADMTWGFVVKPSVASTTPDVRLSSKFTSATRGYRTYIQPPSGGNDRQSFILVNGTPANASVVQGVPVPWNTAFFYSLIFRYTGGNITVWRNGVQVGSATATSGYTAATSSDVLEILRPSTGSTPWELAAAVYAESAISDANIPVWHAQVALANRFDFPGITTIESFVAADVDAGGVAGPSWVGRKGYATLTRNGSPTVSTYVSPQFF
jgi:hypothetical protein